MRTPQEALKDALPAIQAAAEGKAIEYLYGGGSDWRLVYQPIGCSFANPEYAWRVKPEPKRTLRPWKLEEVPVGALMRGTTINGMHCVLIQASSTGPSEARVWFQHSGGAGWNLASTCASTCEHSLDGGKTWLPCGVLEEEQ